MVKTENKEIYFAGISGHYYPFMLYPLHADLPDTSTIYIYTRTGDGFYDALYIGETDKLGSHLLPYDKWLCVNRWFVNVVCVHFEDDSACRLEIVRDLIQRQEPICNDPL